MGNPWHQDKEPSDTKFVMYSIFNESKVAYVIGTFAAVSLFIGAPALVIGYLVSPNFQEITALKCAIGTVIIGVPMLLFAKWLQIRTANKNIKEWEKREN